MHEQRTRKQKIGRAIAIALRAGFLQKRFDEFGNCWFADGKKASDERNVARYIAEAMQEKASWPVELIEWGGEGQPTAHQFEGVANACRGQIGILGGSPGVGKTFVAAAIAKAVLQQYGESQLCCCTPTGKAAVRLTESLQKYNLPVRARTIHSTLGVEKADDGEGWGFRHGRGNPLPYKFIFVDEVSMVDTPLMCSLMAARARGTHVLFIGDIGQLPPVGHGAPLRDFIAAGLPYGELTEIKRNAGTIVRACAAIRRGEPNFPLDAKLDPWPTGGSEPKNLKLIPAAKDQCIDQIMTVIRHVRDNKIFDPIWDVQVVVAVNDKSPVSRKKLNELLQAELNPAGERVEGSPFRVGDKVICLKNSFFPKQSDGEEVFVANGEFGRVMEVGEKKTILAFEQPDRVVLVPCGKQEQAEEVNGKGGDGEGSSKAGCAVDLGYSCTVHKMQGSEAPCIIAALDEYPGATGPHGICSREWLYTACSRARDVCFLVGRLSTAQRQMKEVALPKRKSFLREAIFEATEVLT